MLLYLYALLGFFMVVEFRQIICLQVVQMFISIEQIAGTGDTPLTSMVLRISQQ